MKRLLILILSAFAVSLITPFEAIAEDDALEIKLQKTKPIKMKRSFDFAEVEAWYDSGSMTVTVEGCELKDTFIYIINLYANRLDSHRTFHKPLCHTGQHCYTERLL